MDVFEAIRTRRSIGKVTQVAPPRAEIERLLGAAIEAPNHHENEPWRFFVLTGRAREEFGDVLAAAVRRRMAGQDEKRVEAFAANERTKPLRAPVLIVVGVKHAADLDRETAVEDLEACAAATQNLVLAAHALGLAAQWRTGDGAFDPDVKAWFGLGPADEIAAIVYVGYRDPDRDVLRTRRRSFAARTEWRGLAAVGRTW